MEFLDQNIEEYALNHTDAEPQYLYDLYRETYTSVMRPRMLSGHLQGRYLSMISKMMCPKMIVELGTYTGYSALCMAEGLSTYGKLITLDINEELQTIQKKHIDKSPYANQIELVLANGLDYIPNLPSEIDLVFIDADKENYLNYYKLLLPKMRTGGVIIADNVLWSGKVIGDIDPSDMETKALVEFNDYVQQDATVENILLPIRDGLMVVRKK